MLAQTILSTLLLALPFTATAAPTAKRTSTLITNPDYNFELHLKAKNGTSALINDHVLKSYEYNGKEAANPLDQEDPAFLLQPVKHTDQYFGLINGTLVNYLRNGTEYTYFEEMDYGMASGALYAYWAPTGWPLPPGELAIESETGKLVATASYWESLSNGGDDWTVCYGNTAGYSNYLAFAGDFNVKYCTDVWVEAVKV